MVQKDIYFTVLISSYDNQRKDGSDTTNDENDSDDF